MLRDKSQALNNQLKFVNAQITDEELDKRLKIKKLELGSVSEKLVKWETGKIEKIADEDIATAEKVYNANKDKYKKAKKACKGIIDFFGEAMEMKSKEIISVIINYKDFNIFR